MQTEFNCCDLIPALQYLLVNQVNHKVVTLGSHKGQAWMIHSVLAVFCLYRQEFTAAQALR